MSSYYVTLRTPQGTEFSIHGIRASDADEAKNMVRAYISAKPSLQDSILTDAAPDTQIL